MCSWLAADFSNVAFYSLVSRGDVPVTWADMLSAMAATDVPGLGERAIFRPLSREIIVQQGATIFGVGAGKGDHSDAQRKAWAIELARLILSRL